jgi:hypothetical protein
LQRPGACGYENGLRGLVVEEDAACRAYLADDLVLRMRVLAERSKTSRR